MAENKLKKAPSVDRRRQAFGRALQEALSVRKMTQIELADMVGSTQPSVSAWKSGVNMPDHDMVFKVEKVLRLPSGHLSQFLDYAPAHEDPSPPTVRDIVMKDPLLDDAQKRVMLAVYAEFTSGPGIQVGRPPKKRG